MCLEINTRKKKQQKWSKRADTVCDSKIAIQVFILNWNSLRTRFTYFVWNKICRTVFFLIRLLLLLQFFLLCFIPFRFHTHTLTTKRKNRWVCVCRILKLWRRKKKQNRKKNESSTKRKASTYACVAHLCSCEMKPLNRQWRCVSASLSAFCIFSVLETAPSDRVEKCMEQEHLSMFLGVSTSPFIALNCCAQVMKYEKTWIQTLEFGGSRVTVCACVCAAFRNIRFK